MGTEREGVELLLFSSFSSQWGKQGQLAITTCLHSWPEIFPRCTVVPWTRRIPPCVQHKRPSERGRQITKEKRDSSQSTASRSQVGVVVRRRWRGRGVGKEIKGERHPVSSSTANSPLFFFFSFQRLPLHPDNHLTLSRRRVKIFSPPIPSRLTYPSRSVPPSTSHPNGKKVLISHVFRSRFPFSCPTATCKSNKHPPNLDGFFVKKRAFNIFKNKKKTKSKMWKTISRLNVFVFTVRGRYRAIRSGCSGFYVRVDVQ